MKIAKIKRKARMLPGFFNPDSTAYVNN